MVDYGRDLNIGKAGFLQDVKVQNFDEVIKEIKAATAQMEEATLELKRSRRASELILGQEVEEVE